MLHISFQYCLFTSQLDRTSIFIFPFVGMLNYFYIPFSSVLLVSLNQCNVRHLSKFECHATYVLSSVFKYPDVHLAHAFSFHFCTYLDLFLNSYSSMLPEASSKLTISIPGINVFGVNTSSCTLPST